jgi:hypothetical protein
LILPDLRSIPLHTSRAPALSLVVSLLASIPRSPALSTLKIPCPLAGTLMFRPLPNSVTLSINHWSGRTNLESPKQNP